MTGIDHVGWVGSRLGLVDVLKVEALRGRVRVQGHWVPRLHNGSFGLNALGLDVGGGDARGWLLVLEVLMEEDTWEFGACEKLTHRLVVRRGLRLVAPEVQWPIRARTIL
jgi:hypothetical protein